MGEQDIKRLFLYEHELEIKEKGEVVGKVYQRILNNADVERARREGLRKSAVLRKQLKDKNSADYEIYIASAFDMDRETLVAAIVATELKEYRNKKRPFSDYININKTYGNIFTYDINGVNL